MTDKSSSPSATNGVLDDAEAIAFNAWWATQGMTSDSLKFAAWNGWLARSARSEIEPKPSAEATDKMCVNGASVIQRHIATNGIENDLKAAADIWRAMNASAPSAIAPSVFLSALRDICRPVHDRIVGSKDALDVYEKILDAMQKHHTTIHLAMEKENG